jgi:hypothetical protein
VVQVDYAFNVVKLRKLASVVVFLGHVMRYSSRQAKNRASQRAQDRCVVWLGGEARNAGRLQLRDVVTPKTRSGLRKSGVAYESASPEICAATLSDSTAVAYEELSSVAG